MKHLGQVLKKHVETNHLKKRDIANAVGISYNYLSTIFNRPSMDCELWNKLCAASGLNPAVGFDVPQGNKNYSEIQAQTVVGPAMVTIGTEQQALRDLLEEKERIIAEKERTIQILMAMTGQAKPGQIRDSSNK